ncbi:F-box family protein [Sesbania bispinosa]|nr:F-box family protein [Sesbania bispinosa]
MGETFATWVKASKAKAEYKGESMGATSSVVMSDNSITKCAIALEEIGDIPDDVYIKAN